MSDGGYTVKTASFEGPFGLLLSLVEERKLFISDISLASITEDYLRFVNEYRELHPSEVSNFIVVAATLILIKSKSLLPGLVLTKEEEKDINILADRLKLYEKYRTLAENVKSRFGKKIIFPLEEKKNNDAVFVPDTRITLESMRALVSEVLGRIPQKTFLPEVEVKKVVSIEEMIDRLTDRIQESMQMSFREFSGGHQSKEERVVVIVSFLAMLELVRQGILDAVQDNTFEEITIEKRKIVVENI